MTEKVNVARLLYIAKVILHYSEKESWRLTVGKIMALYNEYLTMNGLAEKQKTIDDIIPI